MSGIDFDHFRERTYTIELEPDPGGWVAVATKPIRDGPANDASLWIAFAMMVIVSFMYYRKVPWRDRTQRRFYVLPFLANLVAAIFYFQMAIGSYRKYTCGTFHLASSRDTPGPDDWQPGAVKGLPRLQVCHLRAGPEKLEWRYNLFMWLAELVTYAANSVETGGLALGIMTIFDKYGPSESGSGPWTMLLKAWPWASAAGFLSWSSYQMFLHRDSRPRRFFFSLMACYLANVGLHGLLILWIRACVFPSNYHYMASAVLDTLLNPGISLWLLKTDIPDVRTQEDEDREVGHQNIEPHFSLSQMLIVVYMVQLAVWYQGQVSP